MMPDNEELVERLRRKRQVQPEQGSGSITVDPVTGETTVKCTITDDGYRLVNPDGPEAATLIEQLHKKVERLASIADRIDRQAECLEKYAERRGFEAKPIPSEFHWEATHFRDLASELRKLTGEHNG